MRTKRRKRKTGRPASRSDLRGRINSAAERPFLRVNSRARIVTPELVHQP